MAKKIPVETEAMVPVSAETLPAEAPKASLPVAVSAELLDRFREVKDNLESVESFRIPRAKMTASGLELVDGADPVLEIEGVLLHTKKTNVYYDKPYNASEILPPTCFSPDAAIPSDGAGIEGYKKQHETCKGCPQAEFGTNQMKSGKACRNLKPLYLLLSDEAIMPRQLTVTPASLKAANQYLLDLTERGISYRKVKTKIALYKESAKDTYYKMRFTMLSKLDEQRQKDVEFLRNAWLSTMNAQSIDAAEFNFDQGQSAKEVPSNGDY